MHNFKVGQTVRLKNTADGYTLRRYAQTWVIDNTPYTTNEMDQQTLSINSKFFTQHFNDFIVVEDVPVFDMHTNPWFIKIANEEEYKAAEAWLAKTYGRNLGIPMPHGLIALTNHAGPLLAKGVYWARNYDQMAKAKEIKLTFQYTCSVSAVVWPEDPNAESKRLLAELQSQITELQAKAENLQKSMK